MRRTTPSSSAATPQWGNVTPFALRSRRPVQGGRAAQEPGRRLLHGRHRRRRWPTPPTSTTARRSRPSTGPTGRTRCSRPATTSSSPRPCRASSGHSLDTDVEDVLHARQRDDGREHRGLVRRSTSTTTSGRSPPSASTSQGQEGQLVARAEQGLRHGPGLAVDALPGPPRGDAAVPGVRLGALDVQRGRGDGPAAFTSSDTFGAYVTIPAGSSKFETNTPATDVTLSWPTFTPRPTRPAGRAGTAASTSRAATYHGRGLGRQVAQYVCGQGPDLHQGQDRRPGSISREAHAAGGPPGGPPLRAVVAAYDATMVIHLECRLDTGAGAVKRCGGLRPPSSNPNPPTVTPTDASCRHRRRLGGPSRCRAGTGLGRVLLQPARGPHPSAPVAADVQPDVDVVPCEVVVGGCPGW